MATKSWPIFSSVGNKLSWKKCPAFCSHEPAEKAVNFDLVIRGYDIFCTFLLPNHALIWQQKFSFSLNLASYLNFIKTNSKPFWKNALIHLFLLSVCHLALLVQPTTSLDIELDSWFHAVDECRKNLNSPFSRLLGSFGVEANWRRYGRPCPPSQRCENQKIKLYKILFIFFFADFQKKIVFFSKFLYLQKISSFLKFCEKSQIFQNII